MRCCTVCIEPCAPSAGASSRIQRRVGGLDGRVLDALAAEPDGVIGFQGLRRRLGAHPEALRRSLARLERDEMASHAEGGYRATDEGHAEAHPASCAWDEILRLALPPDLDAAALAGLLEGKWSGPLRPYGRSDGPGETVFLFVREPGGQLVRIRVVGGLLLVEAEGGSDATLLRHVFRLLSGVTGSARTASSSAKGTYRVPAATAAENPT